MRNIINKKKDEIGLILEKLINYLCLHIENQVKAGADVVQIFDSWANLLDEKDYENYSMSYIKKLIKLLKNDSETKNIPVILFARDPIFNSNVMTESGADCLSLYWRVQNLDLNFLSEKVALQGNLNPKILLEDKNTINKEVKKILAIFKDYPGYIFNLGHGITPDINPDNVKYLTELIRSI